MRPGLADHARTYANYNIIEEPIDARAFEGRNARVLHQFGISAGKDNNPVAPLRVAHHTAAQQHLVIVERIALIVPYERAVELVQDVVRWFAHNFRIELGQQLVVLAHVRRLVQALLRLQIGLAVQFGRFDVAQAVRFTC